MGRMLEALKRIEAKSPQVSPAGKLPPEPLDLPAKTIPSCADALEEMLARVETTAELAAAGISNKQPAQTPRTHESVGLEQPADGGLPGMRWPIQPTPEHTWAYAELAERIVSQLPPDKPASLMFTSPSGRCGKTGMLVSLAGAILERTEGDVLMLDADFRRPNLAARLGVQSAGSLADVLTGVAGWQQVLRRTVLPRLSLLAGGRFTTRGGQPPRLLNLQPLLAELNEHYRLVLINSSSLTDGEVGPITRYCTGTYLVVRLGQVTRREFREAIDVVEYYGGAVLGSVLLGC